MLPAIVTDWKLHVFSVSFLVREHKDLLFCTLCFHMVRRCLCKASDLIKKLAVLGYYQSWTKHFAAVIIAIDFTFIESCKFTQCLINTKFPGLQLVIGELGGLFFFKTHNLKKKKLHDISMLFFPLQ